MKVFARYLVHHTRRNNAFKTLDGSLPTYVSSSLRYSSSGSSKENEMKTLLQDKLNTTDVKVVDISGGCGSMYKIEVTSPVFTGKSRVLQHRMVNDILKEEIKQMHGLTLVTKAS